MGESNFNLSADEKTLAQASHSAELDSRLAATGEVSTPQTNHQKVADTQGTKLATEDGKPLRAVLSAEDRELLQRTQRRNLIIFALLGVLLAVLGFFAGKNIRAQQDDAGLFLPAANSAVVSMVSLTDHFEMRI